MTSVEMGSFERLPVAIPKYGGGSDPFKTPGKVLWKYAPHDLKKEPLRSARDRTEWFAKVLTGIARQTNRTVPYAFRDKSGRVRSLDAGCLAHLFKHVPPRLKLKCDRDGFIVAVKPIFLRSGPAYSFKQLMREGAETTGRLLVAAAEAGDKTTYGIIADVLEHELGIKSINPRHIGAVVGHVMNRILEVFPDAPLINVLVVDATTQLPGQGVDGYLRQRYAFAGKLSKSRKRRLVGHELAATWKFQSWRELFRRVFGRGYKPRLEKKAKLGFDKDGKGDNPLFNAGLPESDEHKRLKRYVAANPQCLRIGLGPVQGRLERRLLSGDRMDVEFATGTRIVGVEVKSIKSGWVDLQRGIFQCIKYAAVLTAQAGAVGPEAAAVLVTERELPGDLKKLATALDVTCRVVRVN